MKPSPEQIIGEVACVVGIHAGKITGRRRTTSIVFARFLVIASARKHHPHFSLRELAALVGRRSHGTAHHALHQFKTLCLTDPRFRSLASDLQLI